MKKNWIYVVLVFVLFMTGCADQLSCEQAEVVQQVGFWHGLWHGLIAGIAFIVSLFNDDIAIYATYNSGGWYDFGFLIGVGVTGSSASAASSRKN